MQKAGLYLWKAMLLGARGAIPSPPADTGAMLLWVMPGSEAPIAKVPPRLIP